MTNKTIAANAATQTPIAVVTAADFAALQAEINRLKEMNATLAANQRTAPGISFKVGDKGNIIIYGLGRLPISLYASQYDRLFSEETVGNLRAFVEANRSKLAVKVSKTVK